MSWSAERVREVLRHSGFPVEVEDVQLVVREERCFTHLPGGLIAWFAENDSGMQRLARERRVLELIRGRIGVGRRGAAARRHDAG